MPITQQSEMWTGAVDKMPQDASKLAPELFADPSCEVKNGVAVVTVSGLVGPPQWVSLATTLETAGKGADGLVVRLSSRASTVRGAGHALNALSQLSQRMKTTVSIYSAGAFGMALAFAQCAEIVVVEDGGTPVGQLNARALYGAGEPAVSAEAVEKVLGHIGHRRPRDLVYSQVVAQMVISSMLPCDTAEAVLTLMNDMEMFE